MNQTSLRSGTFIIFLACCILILLPSTSYPFKSDVGTDKQCSKCHSITALDAKETLKDIVDEVHAIELSVVPGLYIIDATGKNGKRGVIYMDFGKSYIISGSFMSIADRKNVTQREMLQLHRTDISTIPLTDSIVIGNPGARTKMILFTDPQCPFCRKFHPELKKVVAADPDVAIFIKMLPLASLHPDSPRIAKSILCAGSLQLLEDSFADKEVPDPTCESDAVEKTIQLARDLGIGSTPTLILPDGRIAPGFRRAEEILELLKEGK